MPRQATIAPVQVTVRGEVPDQLRVYARRKVEHVLPFAHAPVLFAHLVLALEADPAQERPAHLEVALDVNGTPVRAQVTAHDLREAADLLEEQLRRRLEQLQDRTQTRHRWIGVAGEHEWRHGDLPRRPVPYYPRPVAARQVVRRKTFALQPMTPDEAAYEMDLLDHDFYLFTDLETGADAVIYRRQGGGYGLVGKPGEHEREHTVAHLVVDGPPRTLRMEEARQSLELTGERFVFYLDPADGRGRVLYRRYDGHYGLITPA
jgi:ribosomal subunit interface protein